MTFVYSSLCNLCGAVFQYLDLAFEWIAFILLLRYTSPPLLPLAKVVLFWWSEPQPENLKPKTISLTLAECILLKIHHIDCRKWGALRLND